MQSFNQVLVKWVITNHLGSTVAKGEKQLDIQADSGIKVSGLDVKVEKEYQYTVSLYLYDQDERLLAKNVYQDPFHHPGHPKGHHSRMSHEFGMKLFWA